MGKGKMREKFEFKFSSNVTYGVDQIMLFKCDICSLMFFTYDNMCKSKVCMHIYQHILA